MPYIQIEGLINNPKNNIEIWYYRKKIQKLKIQDLNNDFLLFPLFNVSVSKINDKLTPGIYIEQKEIGLCGSYEINNAVDFKFENLTFEIIEHREKVVLSKILYKNQTILLKKKDITINYQHGFTIE